MRATECERCGKPGTPRQQFTHMGVTICYICADERVDELRSEGSWAETVCSGFAWIDGKSVVEGFISGRRNMTHTCLTGKWSASTSSVAFGMANREGYIPRLSYIP